MIPSSIEILHDLENHEHSETICTSVGEQHIHKENLDCDELVISGFHYRMDEEARTMWIRDAIWTAMYEYVFFLFTPVTQLMTGELVDFNS